MTVGLITRDASGNVLLDTATAMFRLLGQLHIRWMWSTNGGSTLNDKYGSHVDAGLLLGTPFLFTRPESFRSFNVLENTTGFSITASGDTISWEWFSYEQSSTPVYVDIFYGVRS